MHLCFWFVHLTQLKDRYELLLKEVTHSAAGDASGQAKEHEV